MSFAVDVKKWAEKAGLDVVEAKRAAALQIFSAVVVATPVGNPSQWERPQSAPQGYAGGRLRGNWQTSLNAPTMTETGRVDATGKQAISEVEYTVSLVAGDETIYMTNNLPYARRIEFGAHSKQAPSGMVRVTVLAWQQAVKAATKAASK